MVVLLLMMMMLMPHSFPLFCRWVELMVRAIEASVRKGKLENVEALAGQVSVSMPLPSIFWCRWVELRCLICRLLCKKANWKMWRPWQGR